MQFRETLRLRQGYIYVALAAALWAVSGTVSKFLFLEGVSPLQLVQLRTTISFAALLLCVLVGSRRLLRIGRKDLPYLLLLGIVLAATQFTYLFAISRIKVAAAILLQYQSPVLIALYAVLFEGKRPSLNTLVAIMGAVTGCYLMVGAYHLDIASMNRLGIASGLASAAGFALYTVKSEEGMRAYGPWTVLLYALLFAALSCNLLQPPFSAFAGNYGKRAWYGILFVSLIGTIVPFGLYNKGIRLIRSTHANITATIEPVIAGVAAYLFIGEALEGWQAAGALLVIGSILFLQAGPETP